MLRLFVFLAFATLPGLAAAQERCHARVNGSEVEVAFDAEADAAWDITRREALTRAPGRLWNWVWRDLPDCNSAVLIDALSDDVAGGTEESCLAWVDASESWVLAPGPRNFRGRCTGRVCNLVTATTGEVASVVAEGVRQATSPSALATAGLHVVTHGADATILSGPAGTLAANLSAAGSALAGMLSAPAMIAAGTVTVVAAGGALFVCAG